MDTGAGRNFIRRSELPPEDLRHALMEELPEIWDANKNPIRTAGALELLVRLGVLVLSVEFIVCEVLAAPVVLFCDYCDRLIETIRPCVREVELEDGSIRQIVRRPALWSEPSAPLPPSRDEITPVDGPPRRLGSQTP